MVGTKAHHTLAPSPTSPFSKQQEPGSYEFAQMRATSNSLEEAEKGRLPHEMSRPATDTRAGFMESQGAGNHVMMCADLAVKLGVPIYGIVALTNTATDKVGIVCCTVAKYVPLFIRRCKIRARICLPNLVCILRC